MLTRTLCMESLHSKVKKNVPKMAAIFLAKIQVLIIIMEL